MIYMGFFMFSFSKYMPEPQQKIVTINGVSHELRRYEDTNMHFTAI